MNAKTHWEDIYSTKAADGVSWFQPHSEQSLQLISEVAPDHGSRIIDVGGGASTLVDDLLANGYESITVLDIAETALNVARERLVPRASRVTWLAADITTVKFPPHSYDVWHDRAVFHFLTSAQDRRKYIAALASAVNPGGHVIISTFALDGPEHCSGLEIVRYSPESLTTELGGGFILEKSERENHHTPFDTEQSYIYCRFTRL